MSSESERLRSSWIANASAWSDAVRGDLIESRRAVTKPAILAAIVERNPQRVLDVGCGEGWLARELHARGIDVTGIDASEPLITAARGLGGGTFLVKSYDDVIADPSSLGVYDVAVANFSLLDQEIEPLLRALRGTLIVQTVHPFTAAGDAYVDGWRTETFASMPGEWREPMPWYFRTLGTWVRTFTSAGCVVDEIREPIDPQRAVPASIIFACSRPAS